MKSRKIKKDKNEKYKPGLIARISSLRYKDEKSGYLFYFKANFIKKWLIKESFHVNCKILTNRRNYWKVRILSEDPEHKDLKLDEEWKVEKRLLKIDST